MKISEKRGKIELTTDNNTIDNNLELVKYATEVQTRIKEDINSDYVLAVIEEKDKEAIKEMVNNAYLSKRMIKGITYKKVYKWIKEEKRWIETNIEEETAERIREIADEVFDIHMIRHHMKVTLERNKVPNPILTGLMGTQPNKEITEEQEETIKERIIKKMKREKDEKGET